MSVAARAPRPRPRLVAAVPDVDPGELDEVQAFAEGLPESFLQCREMGHSWRPFTAGRFADGGFERVLRCSRCKTRREQGVDRYGRIVSSSYVYPEGYAHAGMGRIVGDARGVLRLESIRRVVTKEEGKNNG